MKRNLADWLATPLGRRCLANEQRLVRRALDRVFGEQLLQIGTWGPANSFLRFARTQRRALVDWGLDRQADIVCEPTQLAIASDTIDAVILPHTLERIQSPHALLREVDRVLRADGQLIVLSFAPTGAWGIRHLFSPGGYPAGQKRMIREGRLRDWLELLGFEVAAGRRYCHTLPLERFRRVGTFPKEEWAQRWLPMLSGGYLLHAQKRVQILTPIRPAWRQPRLRAVGRLEPSTRVSPVASAPSDAACMRVGGGSRRARLTLVGIAPRAGGAAAPRRSAPLASAARASGAPGRSASRARKTPAVIERIFRRDPPDEE
ncbi:MAG TPA: methyltransferase domain-containing protein [Gammaproteobacteria bacterium]|nr:methyltransferase domain-containing protein [Gammaproteobacteria bacterium]